ncbi:dockerin type I repeat-containing protein [Candidatus Parcubacteria bacterium]|nr:dockerin type I repeat-containing protein [Candidatus Parcubacteria bacterium]
MRNFNVLFIIILIFFGSFFILRDIKAQEFLPTSVTILISCGDGLIEGLEICDPGGLSGAPINVGSSTCADFNDIFGNPFISGNLDCLTDCTDFDDTTCFTCGNTHKEDEEACDANDFGSATCATFGLQKGSLICTPQCQISIINCEAMTDEGTVPSSGGGGYHGGSSGFQSGYKPGSDEKIDTAVVIKGKAYPNADVHILVDGKVLGIVKADSKADFYFETTEIEIGVATLGFWSEDVDGLKSTLLTLTLRVIAEATTNITGVYIAPSINIDKQSVKQGDDIKIFGQSVPETEVNVHIHSEEQFIEKTNSTESGRWELIFNTMPLEEDFHIAKALFRVNSGENVIESGFSKLITFHVGREGGEPVCPEADLNADGRVNIVDFSILLYHWGSDNVCADQNQNGKVDLIDFSIMMYYWTG